MKRENKYIKLKNGKEVLLCSPKDEYIDQVLNFLIKTCGETDYLLRYPEECKQFTYEGEKKFFKMVINSNDTCMLLCVVDHKVVGTCQIDFNNLLKTKHRASIALAILKEYWGMGIGTLLLSELEKIARERSSVTHLELEYVEGNTRAKTLYEKNGFVNSGVKLEGIQLKDGTLLNIYSMTKRL